LADSSHCILDRTASTLVAAWIINVVVDPIHDWNSRHYQPVAPRSSTIERGRMMGVHTRTSLLAVTVLLAACTGGSAGPASQTQAAAEAPVPRSAPSSPSRSASPQSCFAPLAGHPTAAEQRAFVAEVNRLATAAEQEHGVPAAAVAAMAIQESGYGWTDLAQQTNNILAWKYTTAEAAGGRDSWVLDCGTSHDRYIVFADRSEAVDFVARQLATSDNYAADTATYRQDRARGVPVVEAVDRWVDGIADPYSSQPDAYRGAIKRLMNNPLNPSERTAPDQNLYRLSESVQAARSGRASSP
jgi:hypothetical protein